MARARSDHTRGILWMVLSSVAYACSFTTVRELSEHFSIYQLVVFRTAIATTAMLPWLAGAGVGALRTQRLGLYALRAIGVYTGNLAWFYALAHLTLADATAISFLAPLWTIVVLAVWLRERITGGRLLALGLGVLGALVLVRPGFDTVGPAVFAAIYMALAYGSITAIIRVLALSENPNAVVFYMFALNLPLALGPGLLHWSPPTWGDAPWILAFGGFSLLAQIFMTRSLACAEAAVVMPAFYLQLPLAAAFGFLLFDQTPELWVIPGAALIAAGGLVALRNESSAARDTSRALVSPTERSILRRRKTRTARAHPNSNPTQGILDPCSPPVVFFTKSATVTKASNSSARSPPRARRRVAGKTNASPS